MKQCTPGEQGATLLEFALIAPLLFALLLGVMTAGLAYSADIALNGAVREAARFGATLPVNGDMSAWLNDVGDVTVAAATGDLDDGEDGRFVCVSYTYPDGTLAGDRTARLTIAEDGTRVETVGASCYADGRPDDERRIQVQAVRNADIQAVIYTQTVALTAEFVVLYERAGP